MCGVVGVIGSFSEEEGLAVVSRMNNTLVHRGPDDQGSWATNGFAFAMRRLSIIDLQSGHQPIWTEDGVGIVFNGEIYNYRSLRSELVEGGYPFHTNSDTEVLLRLYHRDSIEAVHKLQGMFAVCIYDPRFGTAYLVRDRLGIKPLYYGSFDGRFYFASEIKAILSGLNAKPQLNLQALHHYLTLRYVPAPETIWRGIYKLEPGHILTFNLATSNWQTERYWQVQFKSDEVEDDRDYVKEFEELFLDAVEKRLVASDVPVGVLLSGGLDSSAVSAAAVEMGHREFHTFSVAFSDGGEFDETPYARKMASHIGSIHHEVVITQHEFLEFLEDLVRFTDEPLADLASVPLYYVSRLARQYVKVVLSGEGSDEVLVGYNIEQLANKLSLLHLLWKSMPTSLVGMMSKVLPGKPGKALNALSKDGWSGFLSNWVHHMTYHWAEEEKRDLWGGSEEFYSTNDLIQGWYGEAFSEHPLDQLQHVYCRSWLVEDLLMKADKMTMATSLELRVPFLDHALVEWAAKLPLAWKVGTRSTGFSTKLILREFAKKRLPQAILTRPKQGFPVPVYRWLTGELGTWAENLITDPKAFIAEYLDISQVNPVFSAARQGDIVAAHKVWVLIIAEYWMRQWL